MKRISAALSVAVDSSYYLARCLFLRSDNRLERSNKPNITLVAGSLASNSVMQPGGNYLSFVRAPWDITGVENAPTIPDRAAKPVARWTNADIARYSDRSIRLKILLQSKLYQETGR